MAWLEFSGEYKWVQQSDGWRKQELQTTTKPINPGCELVLFEKRSGFIKRKLDSRISVRIIDDKVALLKLQRPHVPSISAGILIDSEGGGFTHSVPVTSDPEITERFVKQDICIHDGIKLRGIMWVNEAGERVNPIVSTFVNTWRNYYDNDTDADAIKILSEHREREEKREKGILKEQTIGSFNGMSIGISYEEAKSNNSQTKID